MHSRNLSYEDKRLKELHVAKNLIVQTEKAAQVLWMYMPISLSDSFKSEMLLVNSVVAGYYPHPENLSEALNEALSAVPDKNKTLVLFNLDKYVQTQGARSLEEIRTACRSLYQKFGNFPLEKIIVHTGYLDKALKEIFFEQNIFLIQKNLSDDRVAGPLLQKLLPVFLPAGRQDRRNYIRVTPDEEVRVRIKPGTEDGGELINGTVEDMGLSGLSISVQPDFFGKVRMRDILSLQVWLPRNVLRIDTAVVAWKREGLNQLGLYFDAQNSRMISREHAAVLSYYMLLQIKMSQKLARGTQNLAGQHSTAE